MYFVYLNRKLITQSADLVTLRKEYTSNVGYVITKSALKEFKIKGLNSKVLQKTHTKWDFSKIPDDIYLKFETYLKSNMLKSCKDIIHKYKVGVVCCSNDNIEFIKNKHNGYLRNKREVDS
jgi:hypothetical protein